MRRVSMIVVLVLCTLLCNSISSAQSKSTLASTTSTSVPNLIRYSGTLKDTRGTAVPSTAIGVTFAIYNQQDGGVAVWQEMQNVTPDDNGQYSVLLGSTTAAGLPDDMFSQQEQRWLGVQVQGQEEQARVLLVSVPYAFKAREADTLGGLPSSAFVKVPSTDEVSGTTANPLNLAGITSAAAPGNTSVPPATSVPVVAGNPCPTTALNPGVAVLPIFTTLGTSDLLCDSVISQSGLTSAANVGIANTTPKTTLDVNGVVNTSQYYQIGLATALRLGGASVYVGQDAGPTTLLAPYETFVGFKAGHLSSNFANTYIGFSSGARNTTGHQNTYVGSFSGVNSTVGAQNTLIGDTAGGGDPGNRNVMLGFEVGINDVGGNDNINIWSPGASESNTIRIGFPYSTTNCFGQYTPPCGQTSTYIAGIYNVSLSSGYQQVIIDATGHLGSTTSTVGGVTGNCATVNYIAKWLGNMEIGCTSITELANTNVGIGLGTTNPQRQLEVNGDITAGLVKGNTTYHYQITGQTVLSIDGLFNVLVGVGPSSAGSQNTLLGAQAGAANTGSNNTFSGSFAGAANTSGSNNTFSGAAAGQSNTTAPFNAFFGYAAGADNSTLNNVMGEYNTFVGAFAGERNTTGQSDTYLGYSAGSGSITGTDNIYVGYAAGSNNAGGNENIMIGTVAGDLSTGSNNIFMGFASGAGNQGGSNIYLGNVGVNSESNTLRIGDSSDLDASYQTAAYIAGIYNSTATPMPPFQSVCVDANGTIFGTTPGVSCVISSLRFKDHIADMGDSSSKLLRLRPVTFFYKPQYDDGSHLLQYGLIAEEVAKVYPEMAVYDKQGQPYSVKYQLLAPMLLNELQKEHTVAMSQQHELQTQLQQIKAQQQQAQAQSQEIDGLRLQLQQQNASLQKRLSKLESYVATQTQIKSASDVQPAITASPSGDSQ